MIDGHLMEQLNEALLDAYPAVRALRMLVRFECNENLDAFAPVDDLEAAVFELTRRAEAHNWLGKLVRGARARNPGNELLRATAEALGYGAPGATEPPPAPPAIDLAWPFKFDMEAQVKEVLGTLPARGVAGYAVPDDTPYFLEHLRARLHNDLGRDCTYCHAHELRISQNKQQLEKILTPLVRTAKGNLIQQDVVFFVTGWRSPEQVEAFWATLTTRLAQTEMPHALAIILAYNPLDLVSPQWPAGVHLLPPPRFETKDLRAWIRALVNVQGWPRSVIDSWEDAVLPDIRRNDELVPDLVYDHLWFTDTELRHRRSFEEWQVVLQQRSASNA